MILKDNEFFVTDGSVGTGIWTLTDGMFSHFGSVSFDSKLIASCELVSDFHGTKQSGTGQIAGGLLGMAIAGPLGAIGGLMTGGKSKVDETVIYCSLSDGRTFKAKSTPTGYAMLRTVVQQNNARPTVVHASKGSEDAGDSKECPNCAETVKAKARQCRFCGYSFEIGDSAILSADFLKWKKSIEKHAGVSFPAEDVNLLYHALVAIDKIGSSIDENYSMEMTTFVQMENWAIAHECDENMTPNKDFFEGDGGGLEGSVNVINSTVESPKKLTDEFLIKAINSAVAAIH